MPPPGPWSLSMTAATPADALDLTDDPPAGPPAGSARWRELALLREPVRLAAQVGRLRQSPRGDGRLTVDIPGWMAPAESTAPIRAFLRRLGHDARGWGLGVNGSDVEATGELFLDRLEHLVDRTERPANLVGWSLGGVIARESARRRPDLVHRVVTFGTPAIGGPTHTAGALHLRRAGVRPDRGAPGRAQPHRPDHRAHHRHLHPQRRRRRLAGLHRPILGQGPPRRGPVDPRRARHRPRRRGLRPPRSPDLPPTPPSGAAEPSIRSRR